MVVAGMIDVRDIVMMVEGLAEGMHVILISYTVHRCVEGRPDYSALIIITLYNFNDWSDSHAARPSYTILF